MGKLHSKSLSFFSASILIDRGIIKNLREEGIYGDIYKRYKDLIPRNKTISLGIRFITIREPTVKDWLYLNSIDFEKWR